MKRFSVICRRSRNYDFGYVLASGNTMASSLDAGLYMPLRKIGSQRLGISVPRKTKRRDSNETRPEHKMIT
jgi:hypothetical protein